MIRRYFRVSIYSNTLLYNSMRRKNSYPSQRTKTRQHKVTQPEVDQDTEKGAAKTTMIVKTL